MEKENLINQSKNLSQNLRLAFIYRGIIEMKQKSVGFMWVKGKIAYAGNALRIFHGLYVIDLHETLILLI